MKRILVVPVLALVVSISALTACSGEPEGETPSGVGDSFAARATSVCQTTLESKQAWSAFPAADFDPNRPMDCSPRWRTWLEDDVAPTFEAWLDGLTAWAHHRRARDGGTTCCQPCTFVELNADRSAAAKSDDVEGFVEAKDGLQAIQSELERATASAGVAACADVHK